MSILSTLRIAAETLRVQQKAIQTTGQNISNVATPGYSRQRVDLTSAVPSFEAGLLLGQGVRVEEINSVVSNFLEAQLVSLNDTLGFTEAENRGLSGVADAFPLTEGGIEAALDTFFGGLSDLSNNPAGQAERISLIGKAQALGDALRQTRDTLGKVQVNLDKDLDGVVRRVNTLVSQIAALNKEVVSAEAGGGQAGDFRDQRQLLVQELSRLTGATVLEESDGSVTVTTGSLLLVSGTRAGSLDDSNLNPSGFRKVFFKNPDGVSFDATSLLKKGEIGGILFMRDTEVPGFIARVDKLAKNLVDEVNTQHALGFDLNGTAGGDFFDPIAAEAGAAANVKVKSTVVADPKLIAASKTAAGVPGDNGNALALVNLRDKAVAALGTVTFKDYFLTLVGDVGAKARTSDDSLVFETSLLAKTEARREEVSGVNLDEEMTKLILFQRAFEAASLVVRTGDELLQTVLEMVR